MVESETLRTEKEKLEAIIAELRRKNDMLRTDRSRKTQQQKLPTRSSHPKPAAVDSLAMDRAKEMAVIDVDEPVLMTNVREESGRRTANTDIHTLRTLEPSVRTVEPSRRTLDESTRRRTMEKSNHSRSQATERYRSWGRTSAADGITSRVSKRRWADRVAGPDEGSLSVQKAKRVSNISRFAHGGGGNNSFAANSNRVQSFGGDWQRRVSTVPRPSATPDRMRRAGRRPARAVNPMASRL